MSENCPACKGRNLIEEQKKLNQETKNLIEEIKEEREKLDRWLTHYRDVTELMVSKRSR